MVRERLGRTEVLVLIIFYRIIASFKDDTVGFCLGWALSSV